MANTDSQALAALQAAVTATFPDLVASGRLAWDAEQAVYEYQGSQFNLYIGGYGPAFGNQTRRNHYLASLLFELGKRRDVLFSAEGEQLQPVLDAMRGFIKGFTQELT